MAHGRSGPASLAVDRRIPRTEPLGESAGIAVVRPNDNGGNAVAPRGWKGEHPVYRTGALSISGTPCPRRLLGECRFCLLAQAMER